ncbi:MAG: tyrosinase family protein [Bacteroidetes bacterium]|nr:tyrosinase family protein [Bacteroidota bacterium]
MQNPDLDAALNQTTFPLFTQTLETGTLLHNNVHSWIGGVMNTQFSPNEPAFTFKHGFIDKTWQDWVNLNNKNYMEMQDWVKGTVSGTGWTNPMPCFQGNIDDIDPNTIWDSRFLDIWYATDNLVILDRHTVGTHIAGNLITVSPSDPRLYKYTTGTIEAKNDFIVPSGADCTFEASGDNKIILGPGFSAKTGSMFRAFIN